MTKLKDLRQESAVTVNIVPQKIPYVQNLILVARSQKRTNQHKPAKVLSDLQQQIEQVLIEHGQELDLAWRDWQILETGILRTLEQERLDAQEHDSLFSLLGEIRQRMTEIQQEIDTGPNWFLDDSEYD